LINSASTVTVSVGAILAALRIILTGASLKWATAKVERVSQRGNGERTQGRERQAERGSNSNDQPPSEHPSPARPREDYPGGVLHQRSIADPGH
jgi:hypothetical protein